MKTRQLITTSLLVYILFTACKQWEVPADLIGDWQSKQKVTIRTKENGKYIFHAAPDSLLLHFTIDEKGNINGQLGNAKFKDCKIFKNRNGMEKKMNLATDYVIKGGLEGSVFPGDPYDKKEVDIPFDMHNNKMTGSFFQRFGWDLFPITGMDAVKK